MINILLSREKRCSLAAVVLLSTNTLIWAQSGPENLPDAANNLAITTNPNQPLSPTERQKIVTALLTDEMVSSQTKGHKVRALRVTQGFVPTDEDKKDQKEYRVTVILFDYTTGRATRNYLDPQTGRVISQEKVIGRPQASEEEVALAKNIVQQDAVLSGLLGPLGTLAGGFIVDGPAGKPVFHRYLQLRLFSADFSHTVRVVIVDLTDETIVPLS